MVHSFLAFSGFDFSISRLYREVEAWYIMTNIHLIPCDRSFGNKFKRTGLCMHIFGMFLYILTKVKEQQVLHRLHYHKEHKWPTMEGCFFNWFLPLTTNTTDANGRKVSGNFGNFPWKVSGILKGWEFWEFSILTYFLHFMRLFIRKSTKLNLFCTNNPRYCFCTIFW